LEVFKRFALLTNHKDIFEKLRDDLRFIESKEISLNNVLTTQEIQKSFSSSPDSLKLGKLCLKQEAAGNVRVFAMVDA